MIHAHIFEKTSYNVWANSAHTYLVLDFVEYCVVVDLDWLFLMCSNSFQLHSVCFPLNMSLESQAELVYYGKFISVALSSFSNKTLIEYEFGITAV